MDLPTIAELMGKVEEDRMPWRFMRSLQVGVAFSNIILYI
jgi:hypothetical protein